MLLKPLGRTNLSIPEVGLGTSGFSGGPVSLLEGFAQGALFVDTAESYGTEPVVGQALKDKSIRERVFLATKVSTAHFRQADVLRAADRSLQLLGVDHIDLYQLHFPSFVVPLEETLGAMEQLVDAGKIRFIGVSNFTLAQLRKAQRTVRKHPIVSNQVRFNLLDRTIEGAFLDYCQSNGVTVIAYTPLSRGVARLRKADPAGVLDEVARASGKTVAQVALNWCLSREPVVVIPKANSPQHIRENCGASGWRLDPTHLRLLDDKVRFRRRSRLETLLRWYAPVRILRACRSLLRRPPPSKAVDLSATL